MTVATQTETVSVTADDLPLINTDVSNIAETKIGLELIQLPVAVTARSAVSNWSPSRECPESRQLGPTEYDIQHRRIRDNLQRTDGRKCRSSSDSDYVPVDVLAKSYTF